MLEIESEHVKGALLGILYLTKHAKAKTDSIVIAFAQLLELLNGRGAVGHELIRKTHQGELRISSIKHREHE